MDSSGCRQGCPSPLPSQAGHSRCRQKVPVKSVCDRDLIMFYVHTRGYHHDLSYNLSTHATRSKAAFRSVDNIAPANPLQTCVRHHSRAGERQRIFKQDKIQNGGKRVDSRCLRPRAAAVQVGRASPSAAPRRISGLENGVDTRLLLRKRSSATLETISEVFSNVRLSALSQKSARPAHREM